VICVVFSDIIWLFVWFIVYSLGVVLEFLALKRIFRKESGD